VLKLPISNPFITLLSLKCDKGKVRKIIDEMCTDTLPNEDTFALCLYII